MTRTMLQELNELHDHYAVAINIAVADDDLQTAHQLADDYDREAIELIAVREGKTHLLPLQRQGRPDSALRRLVARLGRRLHQKAA